ncbi:MAG: hypothetical protein UR89_C0016G0007 [Candidatus Roizmanbacteria bacterium GW2011_GWA2_35_8]|uniref:Uncharacterized protein n=1 Tax=Candidatus Roizmanbacteria bacterium GW2011_GWA2_35_8 TaxID=1618479 RepID=A0A0G0D040_9BACT|nr:MAG: hypothetical protein UR89_C0016G0007 [Candidatus Roizmanbacteria bacterium GW2011_GWA2_35_8]
MNRGSKNKLAVASPGTVITISFFMLLAVILFVLLDPSEQAKKGSDQLITNISTEIYSATVRATVVKLEIPLKAGLTSVLLNSKEGLEAINTLIGIGELKKSFIKNSMNQLSKIYLTTASDQSSYAICFKPESKNFKKNSNNMYDQFGEKTGCNKSKECYYCLNGKMKN